MRISMRLCMLRERVRMELLMVIVLGWGSVGALMLGGVCTRFVSWRISRVGRSVKINNPIKK